MKRSLLIVEDDADLLEVLAVWFTRSGYNVVSVVNPRLALEAAGLRQFEVALIDLGLPGMDGLELMRRLARVQGAMQVVILSGSDYPVSEAKGAAVFASVLKPCSLKLLEALVSDAFTQATNSGAENRRPLVTNEVVSIDDSSTKSNGLRAQLGSS